MKHSILCAALALIIVRTPTTAQTVTAPARLDITPSAGISFPISDFGSTSTNEAGFASTGVALSLALTYRPVDLLDVGGQIVFSSNAFDEARFADALGIPEGIIKTGYYLNMGFMLMTGLNLPVAPSVDYNVRLYGGMLWAQSPDFKGTWIGVTEGLLPSGSAYPFVYGAGTGVKIHSFDLSVRYLMAEPEYEISLDGEIGRLKQPVDMVLLTLGYVIPIRPGR